VFASVVPVIVLDTTAADVDVTATVTASPERSVAATETVAVPAVPIVTGTTYTAPAEPVILPDVSVIRTASTFAAVPVTTNECEVADVDAV
jgi:hypothetical protein